MYLGTIMENEALGRRLLAFCRRVMRLFVAHVGAFLYVRVYICVCVCMRVSLILLVCHATICGRGVCETRIYI